MEELQQLRDKLRDLTNQGYDFILNNREAILDICEQINKQKKRINSGESKLDVHKNKYNHG